MKKIFSIILLISICLMPTGTGCTKVRALTPQEKSLVQFDNQFGFKLFQEIVKQDKDKNVFISPLSVAMALGMVLNGANGATREAMVNTLEISGLTEQQINESYQSLIDLLRSLDPKVKFQIANSIWYERNISFEKLFFDQCIKYFDAKVSGLNFSDANSVKIINDWVNENTNGYIKEIVKEIPPYIVIYLINAIYFKGMWTSQFNEKDTKDDFFTLKDGSNKSCKMMNLKDEFQYYSGDTFQAIDLPYGDNKYSMTIFLPAKDSNIDIFMESFTQDNWNRWFNDFHEYLVQLKMPRFTLEYELLLNKVLRDMGMDIAFTGSADFSRMSKTEDLLISEVKHKTYIKVDEEGTEAAAVTSVGMGKTSIPLVENMLVDRPFVFIIREHYSNTIIFMGKVIETM